MLGIEPSTFVSKIDILTTTPIVHIHGEKYRDKNWTQSVQEQRQSND